MKLLPILLSILVSKAYIPPYTDEDQYADEDETGIDGDDDADAKDE
jgi:hypothetical protein